MKLNDLVTGLHELAGRSVSHKLDSGESIVFKFDNRDEIKNEFPNISFDKIGKEELAINLTDYPGLFYDKVSFLQYCSNRTFETDIGIVFYDGSYLYFEANTKTTIINSTAAPTDNFIENAQYYLILREEFKKSKVVSYHSSSNREYVLISPEYGKLTLGYPLVVPEFPNNVILKEKYALYESMNKTQEYEAFLKGHIIKLLGSYEHDQAFPEFIKRLNHLIEASNKDYEIFVNKFSFEKLKENFKKERDEYFSAVRDLINQLLAKVVAIPVSISASALAVYNLKSDPVGATVVVVAYVIYSLFTSYLFRLLNYDVLELRHELTKEIEMIKDSSKVEIKILELEAAKVFRKIRTLNSTLIILQLLLAILSTVVLFVYFQFTLIPTNYSILLLALILDLQLAFSFFGLNNKRYFTQ